ncbi:MAG: BolA family protein [Burkholderiales bacterium]
MNTIESMKQRLTSLSPESLEILDDSGQHLGHEGAKGGGGHYQLLLVSAQFHGVALPARHRMVYDALGSMMKNEIHALSIKAYAPDEI